MTVSDYEIHGQNAGHSGNPVVPVLYGAGAGAFNFNGRHGYHNDGSILNGEMLRIHGEYTVETRWRQWPRDSKAGLLSQSNLMASRTDSKRTQNFFSGIK